MALVRVQFGPRSLFIIAGAMLLVLVTLKTITTVQANCGHIPRLWKSYPDSTVVTEEGPINDLLKVEKAEGVQQIDARKTACYSGTASLVHVVTSRMPAVTTIVFKEFTTVTLHVTVSHQPSVPTALVSNSNKSKFPNGVFRAYEEDYSSLLTPEDTLVLSDLRNYTLPKPTSSPSILAQPVFFSSVSARHVLFTNLYSIGSPLGPATWKLYLNSLSASHLPPLTHIAQYYIYIHQHPSVTECQSSTRFLVLPSYRRGSGLGSILHGATHALSAAIRSGRVLIYDDDREGTGDGNGPPGQLFSGNGEACPDGKVGMNCFFEKITSCQWSDVRLNEGGNAIRFKPYDPSPSKDLRHPVLGYGTRYGDIPPILGKLLQEWEISLDNGSGIRMSPNARKLWWRGQGVGYLARINPWAMRRIKEARLGTDNVRRFGVKGIFRNLTVPFPLPPSTVSIHVRHGDKSTEMSLVPFSTYLIKASDVVATNPSRGSLSKIVFLSTEDPSVINEMHRFAALDTPCDSAFQTKEACDLTTSNLQWTFFYTKDVPRNNGGPGQEVQKGNEVETTLLHLGEMMLSLEAGMWVGTRASNWCRLVEELAQVWIGGNANTGDRGLFVEVGEQNDWVDYHF